MQTQYNPDQWAAAAKGTSGGFNGVANPSAVWAIRARAGWVLVNGKWVPRAGVMRDAL